MTNQQHQSFHTVDSEWLAAYSAGALSDAKRLLIGCQIALQPRLAASVERIDQIGGAFVETAKGEDLSDRFERNLAAALDRAESAPGPAASAATTSRPAEAWMPGPLQDFLDKSEIKLNWRQGGPGVERAPLYEEGGERVYLLKARPGLKMPVHSHAGQEWTLILQGGYHVGGTGYVRGDLHGEDEGCSHQPIIDDHGEACISLVADEGRLKFSNPVFRLLQPLIGI